METLHNGYSLSIPSGCFPLSTDSMILSGFVKLPKDARVLDLGSGCGTLGLLLCANDPHCKITGIEVDERAHIAARDNICINHLNQRMESICADLRTVPNLLPRNSFECCVSNPPYFSGGPASQQTPFARRDDYCSILDLFSAASWALKFGGDFFLVHKPQQLAQLCAEGSRFGMEAKRLQLVRHSPGKEISMILLSFRKGAKPGLQIEELCLRDNCGNPTEAFRKIYHL